MDDPTCAASGLSARLEQLDGVAVGVFQLNLLAGRTSFHFIPKMEACFLEGFNSARKVSHPQDHSVPATGLLVTTIRHRPRARRSRAAEQDRKIPE